MRQKSLNGRKPISLRDLASDAGFSGYDVGMDPYQLHPAIQKELDSKGLYPRFISVKLFQKHYGSHPKGWIPYKPECLATMKGEFKEGVDSEGYVRRGDTILAVKSKEQAEKHKRLLEISASQMDPNALAANTAAELRQSAREAGVRSNIREGYEDVSDEE